LWIAGQLHDHYCTVFMNNIDLWRIQGLVDPSLCAIALLVDLGSVALCV
jgi:hypothetical protein